MESYRNGARFEETKKALVPKYLKNVLHDIITTVERYGGRPATDQRAVKKLMSVKSILFEAFAEQAQDHDQWIIDWAHCHCTSDLKELGGTAPPSHVTSYAASALKDVVLGRATISQYPDKASMIASKVPGATAFEAVIGFVPTAQMYIDKMERHFSATTPNDVYDEMAKLNTINHVYGRHPTEVLRRTEEIWHACLVFSSRDTRYLGTTASASSRS